MVFRLRQFLGLSLILCAFAMAWGVTSTVGADEEQYTYDALGRLKTVTYTNQESKNLLGSDAGPEQQNTYKYLDMVPLANLGISAEDIQNGTVRFSGRALIKDPDVTNAQLDITFFDDSNVKVGSNVISNKINSTTVFLEAKLEGVSIPSGATKIRFMTTYQSGGGSPMITKEAMLNFGNVALPFEEPTGAFGRQIEYSYDAAGNRTARDVASVPGASVADVSSAEGTSLTFTVALSEAATEAVSIDYDTSDASAVAGTDYTSASGTLSFAIGETSKSFTVTTSTDSNYELDETFLVELSNPTGNLVINDDEATGTITNDDTAPSFAINNNSNTEGDIITLTVTKTGSTALSHDVSYATANGYAGGYDYTAASGTLTFASGETSKTINLQTTEDTIYEIDEVFLVNLSSATNGATISDSQGDATIINDDTAPSFAINDQSVTEGGVITFTVTKTGSTALSHDVSYATSTGTAGSGDFTAASGTLTFAAADTTKTFTVTTTQDSTYESSETFTATLSAPTNSATISDATGSGTITNDDAAPSFAINDQSVTEGGVITFTVTKTGSTALSHAVSYATSTGTAGSGDFTAASGTLTFAAADTTKTFTVTTTQDSTYENSETFTATLSAPTNSATISDATGVGNISNDDTAPSFAINDQSVSEGGVITFTVTKTGSTALSHAVSYATSTGTAGSGDFTAASGTLTFATADTTKTFTVSTTADSTYESNETFTATLSAPTNSATISDATGVGTITNDDTAPSFAINDQSVSEGGVITFTVTKTGATEFSHDISYATSTGTAGSGDFTAASGTLTFATADTTKTFTVSTTENSVYESTETFTANLSAPTNGATISDATGVGTITDDDTAPSFSVNDVSVTEGGTLTFTITKSGSTALSHNVSYATANGSATAGSDYTAVSGTLSFGTSETTKTVSVNSTSETTAEFDETFTLNLSSPTNSATISDGTGGGTILDDDNQAPNAVNDSTSVQKFTFKIITVTGNDSDPNGDSFTVTAVTDGTYGHASVNSGTSIKYTHDAGGTFDTVTYTITDAFGATDTATVSITLTGGGGGGGGAFGPVTEETSSDPDAETTTPVEEGGATTEAEAATSTESTEEEAAPADEDDGGNG